MPFTREILLASMFIITIVYSLPGGGGYHHVHHRIHVPQKIKTIYHTKIIKVPEHHHHFHEKEKIIIEKEKPKEEHHPIIYKDEEEESDWAGLDRSQIFKKKRNAHHPTESSSNKIKKRRIVQRHPYVFHKP